MHARTRFLVAVFGIAASILFVPPAWSQTSEMVDGPVPRGTSAEEVRSRYGEPQRVVSGGGDMIGPEVEQWSYADGLVVVVQRGVVIDSFIEKSNP